MTSALNGRDPIAEADAAFANQDLRPIGIYGLGLYYPGLDADSHSLVNLNAPVLAIKGTSDCIKSGPNETFQNAAEDFARHYNQQLVLRIKAR